MEQKSETTGRLLWEWRTETESHAIDGGKVHVAREGLRWTWSVTLANGTSNLEADGYAPTQDDARAEGLRVAEGLRALVK